MKKKIKFNAKAFFTVLFSSVFVLNMLFSIQKDPVSGGLSLSSLKSYAQSNGGELGGGGVTITCSSGNFGQCFLLDYNGAFCECDYSGGTLDSCSVWDILICNPLNWFGQ